MTSRDSLLSIQPSWWPAFFWIFIAQLIWEAIMIILDAGPALSDMSLIDRIRFVRAELADNVVISAVIAMLIAESWRHIMITTQWLENLVERNKAQYDEKIRDQARVEFIAEGRDQGRDQILSLLDEDTRKDIERKLHDNHHPENGD